MYQNLSNSKIPNILYKYRNFNLSKKGETHLDQLINGSLYFSNPNSFNDPFDCQTPINYLEFKDNREAVMKYIQKGIQKLQPNCVSQINPDALTANVDFLVKNMSDDIKNLNNRFGIYSMSKTHTNILMWSHYSNSHTGFCFGINLSKINITGIVSEKVIYEKKYPIISPNDSSQDIITKQLLVKSDKWKYEKEYRLISMDRKRLNKIPYEAIVEIYLGSKISNINERKIMKLSTTILSHCHFYKMNKSESSFELIPKKIL